MKKIILKNAVLSYAIPLSVIILHWFFVTDANALITITKANAEKTAAVNAAIRATLTQNQSKINNFQAEKQREIEKLQAEKNRLQIEKQKEIQRLMAESQKSQNDAKTLQGKLGELSNAVVQNQGKIKSLQTELDKAVAEAKSIAADKANSEKLAAQNMSNAKSETNQALKERDEARKKAQEETAKLNSSITSLKGEITKKEQERTSLDNKLKAAEKLRKEYEEKVKKEKEAANKNFANEKKQLQNLISQKTEKLNEKTKELKQAAEALKNQENSANETEVTYLVGIETLKMEVIDLKNDIQTLLQKAREFEEESREYERMLLEKSEKERRHFVDIIIKSQEAELGTLAEIETLRSELNDKTRRQEAIINAAKILETKLNARISKLLDKIKTIQAEYRSMLIANMETERKNLATIDSLNSQLNEAMTINKTLIMKARKVARAKAKEDLADSSEEARRLLQIDMLNSNLNDAILKNEILVRNSAKIKKEIEMTKLNNAKITKNYQQKLESMENTLKESNEMIQRLAKMYEERGNWSGGEKVFTDDEINTIISMPDVLIEMATQQDIEEDVYQGNDPQYNETGQPQVAEDFVPNMTDVTDEQLIDENMTEDMVEDMPNYGTGGPNNGYSPATRLSRTNSNGRGRSRRVPSTQSNRNDARKPRVTAAKVRRHVNRGYNDRGMEVAAAGAFEDGVMPKYKQRRSKETMRVKNGGLSGIEQGKPIRNYGNREATVNQNSNKVGISRGKAIVHGRNRSMKREYGFNSQLTESGDIQRGGILNQSRQMSKRVPQSNMMNYKASGQNIRATMHGDQTQFIENYDTGSNGGFNLTPNEMGQTTLQVRNGNRGRKQPKIEQVRNENPPQITHLDNQNDSVMNEIQKSTKKKTKEEKLVDFAIDATVNAILKMTNNDVAKTNASMNLIGAGQELPEKLDALVKVIKEQYNPQISDKVLLKITEMSRQKQNFVDESLKHLYGSNGNKLIYWNNSTETR
ncbi:MAG: hypothetical protein LBB34_02875 [Holosporales bacterium]|nr:hypothetical protein [Holosporales bacterium]